MKKTTRNLILLFTGILAIKTAISFFMSGTYFYSDEACLIIKAKHFAENFQLASCSEAAGAPGGDPHPFYSILISPIFIFFKGFNAYLAVLVFNSLLISSLVFPLYGFIKNFIKKESIIFLIIITTLFLPQITIYEKTVLSETSFVFLNIWLLYFYTQYKTLKKKNLRYLILTIIFAIFAGLTRPFGFIVALALLINEFINSKKKLKTTIILTPIIIILFILSIKITGNIDVLINRFLEIFNNQDKLLMALKALKNQINTFTLLTLLAPILVLITNINTKTPLVYQKTKWFFFSLIIMNFLISTNHIYGYLYSGQELDLLTRYINISLIYILLLFFLLLNNSKKSFLNIKTVIFSLTVMFCLIFFNSIRVKHALNLDLSHFFNHSNSNAGNLISEKKLMELALFSLTILAFYLIINTKKKILFSLIICINLITGSYLYLWNIQYSKFINLTHEETIYFKDSESSILLLQLSKNRVSNSLIWYNKTLTKNQIQLKYLDTYKHKHYEIDFYSDKNKERTKNFDYILTNAKLKLPIKKTFDSSLILYFSPKEKTFEEHQDFLQKNNIEFSLNEEIKYIKNANIKIEQKDQEEAKIELNEIYTNNETIAP
jgi:hypothetical protein